MAQRSSLTYLRQKIRVTLLRAIVYCMSYFRVRRDNLLSKSYKPIVEQINIPSRDKKRTIKAFLYAPPTSASPKPILVNWHGSGFILPMLGSDSLFCARIAKEVGVYVLDADYRKAPEHPFPAAVEDVEDALEWVSTQSTRFDTSRVAVSGFSAGANLALVASSTLRKSLKVSIPTVAAFYPVTDLSIDPGLKKVPHPIRPMPKGVVDFFNACYVPDKAMMKDPRVSPALGNLDDFPSTVAILTCSGDILAPEGEDLAKRLDGGGRKVSLFKLQGVPHAFDKGAEKGTDKWDRREESYGAVVKVLKESLNL